MDYGTLGITYMCICGVNVTFVENEIQVYDVHNKTNLDITLKRRNFKCHIRYILTSFCLLYFIFKYLDQTNISLYKVPYLDSDLSCNPYFVKCCYLDVKVSRRNVVYVNA